MDYLYPPITTMLVIIALWLLKGRAKRGLVRWPIRAKAG